MNTRKEWQSLSNQEMRTFETGARRSIEEGKGRYDLIRYKDIEGIDLVTIQFIGGNINEN